MQRGGFMATGPADVIDKAIIGFMQGDDGDLETDEEQRFDLAGGTKARKRVPDHRPRFRPVNVRNRWHRSACRAPIRRGSPARLDIADGERVTTPVHIRRCRAISVHGIARSRSQG
jgi:hypothetical protein